MRFLGFKLLAPFGAPLLVLLALGFLFLRALRGIGLLALVLADVLGPRGGLLLLFRRALLVLLDALALVRPIARRFLGRDLGAGPLLQFSLPARFGRSCLFFALRLACFFRGLGTGRILSLLRRGLGIQPALKVARLDPYAPYFAFREFAIAAGLIPAAVDKEPLIALGVARVELLLEPRLFGIRLLERKLRLPAVAQGTGRISISEIARRRGQAGEQRDGWQQLHSNFNAARSTTDDAGGKAADGS